MKNPLQELRNPFKNVFEWLEAEREPLQQSMIEALYFTRKERAAILMLMVLIATLLGLRFSWHRLITIAPDFSAFDEEVARWKAANVAAPVAALASMATPIQLKTFDPNTVDKVTLLQFGLSPRTAQTIINYRSKGGHFRQKEDLQKIYTLSQEDYNRLAPYVAMKKKTNTVYKESLSTTFAEKNTINTFTEDKGILFTFDPNTAAHEELSQLGLSNKLISTIENYRSKGGSFKKPEDFGKIYGLSQQQLTTLLPYIKIKGKDFNNPVVATEENQPSSYKSKAARLSIPPEEKSVVQIDINQASAEEWQQLKGIGPYFSKRIVKFREALGGFTSIQQVSETYNLPDSTFQSIQSQLKLSPINNPLNINTATESELKAHPYIQWKQAKLIVAYREQHGHFTKVEDLLKIVVLDESFLEKIRPYIRINE